MTAYSPSLSKHIFLHEMSSLLLDFLLLLYLLCLHRKIIFHFFILHVNQHLSIYDVRGHFHFTRSLTTSCCRPSLQISSILYHLFSFNSTDPLYFHRNFKQQWNWFDVAIIGITVKYYFEKIPPNKRTFKKKSPFQQHLYKDIVAFIYLYKCPWFFILIL